jgi:outer membrane protein assembly factor BamD (BamD/ComL family)
VVDDALFQTAKIYDNNLKNKEKASEYYRKILSDHPNSIYSSEARKRFREIREGKTDNSENEDNNEFNN